MTATPARQCLRCGQPLPQRPIGRRGRPPMWCSPQCRRRAYEERRAAASGAVGVRVEVVEKPVERIIERTRTETVTAAPGPAEAARIVAQSPRACRTILESLTTQAVTGELATSAHAPTLRAAERLLQTLVERHLIGPHTDSRRRW